MSLMIVRALPVILAFVALCLPVDAEASGEWITRSELDQTGSVEASLALSLGRPDLFYGTDSATLVHGLPVLTVLDGRRFPISTELGRMGMTPFDVFPVAFLRAVEVQKTAPSLRYGSDTAGGVLNLRTNRIYTGGEVGLFYGRSDGKYGREDFSAHIIGGIGTDKFNITVGAAYHDSSVRVDRRR
jgi:outer membrane receptor protein involved in Fe transport